MGTSFDLNRDGVTQSLLATFLECRQKANLKLERWVPRRTSMPLRYGTLAHSVLEAFQKIQIKKPAFVPSAAQVKVEVAKVGAAYRKEHGSRWGAETEEEFEHNLAQIETIVPEYFKFWSKKPLQWIEVEEVFRIPFCYDPLMKGDVPSKTTWLTGRYDGIFRRQGKLWLFDHKNKSRIDEDQFGSVLLRDFQINFYLLAVWKLTKTIPAGFVYNVIRRPSLTWTKKESLPEHMVRLRKHIAEDPSHYFKRYEVIVHKDDLLQFEQELKEVISDFADWLKAKRPVRMFGQPCVTKYGLCDFVPMCYEDETGPFVRRPVLFSELEDR